MNKHFLINSILAIALAVFATGCGSGPQTTLDKVADALETKDGEAFSQVVDIARCFEIGYKMEKTAFRNTMSQILKGITGSSSQTARMADLVLPDVQRQKGAEMFKELVNTGQILMLCQQSKKPDCPWVPDSLRKAEVKEVADNIAVAAVDTPNGLRQWVGLREVEGEWIVKVVAKTDVLAQELVSDKYLAAEAEAREKVRIAEEQRKAQKFIGYERILDKYERSKKGYAELERKKAERKDLQKKFLSEVSAEDITVALKKDGRGFRYLDIKATVMNKTDKPITVKKMSVGGYDSYNKKTPQHIRTLGFGADNLQCAPGESKAANWKVSVGSNDFGHMWLQLFPEFFHFVVKVDTVEVDLGGEFGVTTIANRIFSSSKIGALPYLPKPIEPRKPKGYDEWKQSQ